MAFREKSSNHHQINQHSHCLKLMNAPVPQNLLTHILLTSTHKPLSTQTLPLLTNTNKTSLLSHIGSTKRWRSGRKPLSADHREARVGTINLILACRASHPVSWILCTCLLHSTQWLHTHSSHIYTCVFAPKVIQIYNDCYAVRASFGASINARNISI